LEAVGGYDEAFTRAQDWEMNYRLRRAGGLVWFTPRLRVSYRPRASISALAKQYVNYGRWRGEVMRQHPDTVTLRYLAPPVAVLANALGVVLGLVGIFVTPLLLAWVVPATYLLGVLVATAMSGRALPWRSRLWLVAVFVTMHMSWGAGFLATLTRYIRRGLR
jgi:succinoglycan biosynthesis protein ExoA